MGKLLEVKRGNTATETVEFVMMECCNCSIPFMIPNYQRKRLLSTRESFYCPNGHRQAYSGPTEADKLKEQLEAERKRNEQDIEFMNNKLLDQINETKKVKKDLNRLKKGVCPCCNRTFTNLHNHLKNQHPEFLTPPMPKILIMKEYKKAEVIGNGNMNIRNLNTGAPKWKIPANEMRLAMHTHPEEIQIKAYRQMESDFTAALDKLNNLCEAAMSLDGLYLHSEAFKSAMKHLFVQMGNGQSFLSTFKHPTP